MVEDNEKFQINKKQCAQSLIKIQKFIGYNLLNKFITNYFYVNCLSTYGAIH